VDFAESDEHRDLRAAVAAIAADFGPSYFLTHAADHTACTELWDALAKAGFIGVNVPVEYGGGGGGLTELVLIGEELAAQGTPLVLLLVSAAICAEVIGAYGNDEQRRHWLPGLATGTSKMVFAITEPDAGSNTHKLATTATRDGDGWRLSGAKYYITGVDEAESLLVVAKTAPDKLSLFVVPTDAPGFEKQPLPIAVMLPERQFTLHFDDVRLGPEALVGVEGDGFRQVFHGLNPERIMGAALGVGTARYVLGVAARYATDRTVWSAPIGTHQAVAHPLAKAKIETPAQTPRPRGWANICGRGSSRCRSRRSDRAGGHSGERSGPVASASAG
jgi:alkylation response protein AidB-like acyl-CoA dehydrogenase